MHLSPLTAVSPLVPCPCPGLSSISALVSEVQSRIAIMECSSTHLQHRTCTLQHCSAAECCRSLQLNAVLSAAAEHTACCLQMVFTADTDFTHNNVCYNGISNFFAKKQIKSQ